MSAVVRAFRRLVVGWTAGVAIDTGTRPDIATAEDMGLPPVISARRPRARARSGGLWAFSWFMIAAVPALTLHLFAAGPAGRRVATIGEASTAAAAFAVARLDNLEHSIRWPDTVAVHQFAVLNVLVGDLTGPTVLDAARTISLIVSAIGCLLVWPVTRQLKVHPAASAAGVALAGVPAAVVAMHGAVDAGVLGALWLTAAAALIDGNRVLKAAAVLAVVAAVITVPLAAVPLLAGGAHLVASGVITPRWRWPAQLTLGVALGLAAVVVALLATGNGPLAVIGDASIPRALMLGVAAVGLFLAGFAWLRQRWLRPAVTAVVALFASAAISGPSSGTAVLLAVPLVAVIGAVVLDAELSTPTQQTAQTHDYPSRWQLAVAGAVAVAIAAAAMPLVVGGVAAEDQPSDADREPTLASWILAELDPSRVLVVDDLTWAQLVRDGVHPSRLVVLGGMLGDETVPADALVALPQRPTRYTEAPRAVELEASVRLARVKAGPGGSPIDVRQRVTDLQAHELEQEADRAQRMKFGQALANNAALDLSPQAGEQLGQGQVDARLMTVLAGFASGHRLEIGGFRGSSLEPQEAPLRTALINAIDGRLVSAPDSADLAKHWLDAQLPPYHPLTVRQLESVLVVKFSAPAPLGLLAPD